ncbi:phospholipase D-like domain-containing protein [Rhodoferax sp.]|uniref:phospholipase D-like domain-containing protein n=1 Tax=Rhodoferax sp. TaxID=50421 RepID=UPI0039B82965
MLVRSGRLALVSAKATVLYDPPTKLRGQNQAVTGHVVSNLRDAIVSIQRELALVSPYFVPQARGVEVLCTLAGRGVRVRVLTNSLASTDVPAVHAAYARYRPQLLACGVVLHELRPSASTGASLRRVISSGVSLHAKAILLDGKSVLIGSMNLDPRSRLSNTEVAVRYTSEPLASWWQRMTSALLGVVIPEDML